MNLPLYNQADQKWRSTPLGTFGRTIGSDGCAISALSMVVGEEPPKVLQKAKALGAIADSGDFFWPAVGAMFPNVRFHYRWSTVNEERNLANRKEIEPAIESIKTLLALGQPVILRVVNPDGVGHFVVAVGWDGDLIVNDPDGGKQRRYKERFGDPVKSLLAYVVLVGPERDGVDCGEDIRKRIVGNAAGALYKAAQLADGKNVATYSREILDTFI